MSSQAPSANDLAGAKLHKVKTNEASGEVSDADKKPFVDIWKKHGGDFEKVKKDSRFSGMAWRDNFQPKDADYFATGVLKGLAFDD